MLKAKHRRGIQEQTPDLELGDIQAQAEVQTYHLGYFFKQTLNKAGSQGCMKTC